MNNQVLFRILEGQNIEGKYYLKKLLGSGGFGGVYLADEVVKDRLIRELAVKLIITDNPDKQLDELIVSTTLKHPNLIDCYTCGECQLNNIEFLYLLMEKADYSLEDELKKGKLSEENVKQLVLDIVNSLDYLHSQNPVIVHRDLKPGNILRIGDKWKISDFGLVRSLKGTATQTTTIIGSMGYAPPEAYDGKISPAWDIWSLGVVIYESLTGKLPFESDSPLQLMRQVADLEPDVKELSTHWQELVKSCLEKNGKQRSTAQLILQTLSSSEEQKQVIVNNEKENTISQKQTRLEPLLTSATETQATISEKNTINQKRKNNISSIPYFGNNLFRCIPPESNIGHFRRVKSVAISKDGKTIVNGSADKTIKIWDLVTGKLRHTLEGHSNGINSVAISADGKTIVSGSDDETIKIWDLATGKIRHTLKGHSSWVNSVAISGDSKTIVSGSDDNTIKIWDLAKGNLQNILESHFRRVNSVAISDDGQTMISGGNDKTIKIWDLATGKLRYTLQGHSFWITSVAISSDRKTIVSGGGGNDKTIKIWDLATGKLRYTFQGHYSGVTSVAISSDGKILASSSRDKTLKIWDLHSGNLLRTIEMKGFMENGVSWDWVANQVLFSPDDTQIIAGCSDGTIKIWDVEEILNL